MTNKENLLRAFNIVADYYMGFYDEDAKFYEDRFQNAYSNYVLEFFPKTLRGRLTWTSSDYPAMERENPLVYALFATRHGQRLLAMGNRRVSLWPEILEEIETEIQEEE